MFHASKSSMTVAGLMMIVGGLLVAGLILELGAVLMAPRGYQDEHGFHFESQANDSRDSHS